jgi:uncharacterized protein DUF3883
MHRIALADTAGMNETERPLDVGQPLSGNKAIEDAAIAFVMRLEREVGRNPIDRRYEAAFAADIESLPRIIEVKAVGGSQRGWFLPLEVPQVNEANTNPDFFVYVVDNVRQGDPTKFGLKVLGGERLARLVANAKERRYFEVPVPVGERGEVKSEVVEELVHRSEHLCLREALLERRRHPADGVFSAAESVHSDSLGCDPVRRHVDTLASARA